MTRDHPPGNGAAATGPFVMPPLTVDATYRPHPSETTFAAHLVRAAAIPGARDLAKAIVSDRTSHVMLKPAFVKAGISLLGQPARSAIPAFMSSHLPMPTMWIEFNRQDQKFGILAERLENGKVLLQHATLLSRNAFGTAIASTMLDMTAAPPVINVFTQARSGLSADAATDQAWIEWLSTVMKPVVPHGRTLTPAQRDRWQGWALQDVALLAVVFRPGAQFQ